MKMEYHMSRLYEAQVEVSEGNVRVNITNAVYTLEQQITCL